MRAGYLAAVGFLLIAGCADDGMGQRYAVTGTIKYHDKPVEKGQITFTPGKLRGTSPAATSRTATTDSPP